jgi:hypothetical protein
MHDGHDEHGHQKTHSHEHGAEKEAVAVTEIEKLKKMTQYWISHNEEHARSYRLWAGRARDAGYEKPGEILEQIASEVVRLNERLMEVIQTIDSC